MRDKEKENAENLNLIYGTGSVTVKPSTIVFVEDAGGAANALKLLRIKFVTEKDPNLKKFYELAMIEVRNNYSLLEDYLLEKNTMALS